MRPIAVAVDNTCQAMNFKMPPGSPIRGSGTLLFMGEGYLHMIFDIGSVDVIKNSREGGVTIRAGGSLAASACRSSTSEVSSGAASYISLTLACSEGANDMCHSMKAMCS
jgi:hypothetical protein